MNPNKCCAKECGNFCGATNCDEGPGGNKRCCGSMIPDSKVCGVQNQTPPCTRGMETSLFSFKSYF